MLGPTSLVIGGLFLAESLRATVEILRTRRHMRSVSPGAAQGDQLPTIVILVPVLREQAVIEATLRHLSGMCYPRSKLRVVAITTAREDREREDAFGRLPELVRWLRSGTSPEEAARRLPGLGPGSLIVPILSQEHLEVERLEHALRALPSTAELVAELVAQDQTGVIRSIHYPFTRGEMAHQVNWGIRYLFEVVDHGIDPGSTWIGVYNADSRPHIDTLAHLARELSNCQTQAAQCVAFQQHSLYRPDGVDSWLPHAAAAWQSRWSLAVEHPRARKNASFFDDHRRNGTAKTDLLQAARCPFNYAIGHGLFVRLREMVEMNYLPEDTPNEDAPFGYLLTLAGHVLRPLPVMDSAEVPANARTLLIQQGGWFQGPLDAGKYRRMAHKRGLGQDRPLLACLLSARVAWDAVAWIAGPVLALVVAVAAFAAPSWSTGAGLLGVLVYLTMPTICAILVAPWSSPSEKPSAARALATMPLFYLVHGLGPFLQLIRRFACRMRGLPVAKYKTER